jgi:uroporphyrinogen decarboxylase
MDGFFSVPRELIGVTNQLVMYYDDPDLMRDIAGHLAELWLAMLERVVSEIELDYVSIWEDMCFKNGPLISPSMFEQFCLPHYRRTTAFLRAHGVDVIWVDTDGDLRLLIPKFIEGGVTGSWPLEAQSGVSVVEVRKKYPRFLLMGGIDKMQLAQGRQAIDSELETKLPYVLSTGGYIPTCDHMVPPDVSWADFCYYRDRVRDYVDKYRLVV